MMNLIIRSFIKDYKNVQDSNVRKQYGMVGGMVGIVINTILSSFKIAVGVFTFSIALIGEGLNNLFDALSSIMTVIGFKISSKPADKEHPFGHGRYEYITGLLVAIVIVVVGVQLLTNSFNKIINPEVTEINIFSFAAIITSILLKLWLMFFYKKLGKRISSGTLQASAMDSLSDILASSVVLIGLIVGFYYPTINIDGYLGLAVSLFIIFSGIKAMKETFDPLLGKSPNPELVKHIEDVVSSYEYIIGVHDLMIHDYGPGRRVISLHAEVSAEEDILKTHDQIDLIERALKEKFHCEVIIHMDPVAINDELTILLHDQVRRIVKDLDDVIEIHDFRLVKGPTHTNLIFDIVLPFHFHLSDEEVKEYLYQKTQELDSAYFAVINIDH